MNHQETDEAGRFISRLPQTHARDVADRVAMGKALRRETPRNVQATWKPPAKRTDPVELLVESSKGRLEDLLPIRYGRMMASPFAFYRGAAAIMAYDLAHTPATGLNVQACGDCHLLNFGGFATAERRLIFDINDFDETCAAPWEWDVKRLAASFTIAGRANGFAAADCRQAAWTAAQSYRVQMAAYAEMPVLEVWYDAIDLDEIHQQHGRQTPPPLLHQEAGVRHRTERPREGVRQAGVCSRRPAAYHRPAPAHLPYRRPAR